MTHPVFDKLFGRLVRRWHRYQDSPRDPDRVTELASARADLDDARGEVAEARARYHPEEPPARPAGDVRRTSVDADEIELLRLRGVFPEG